MFTPLQLNDGRGRQEYGPIVDLGELRPPPISAWGAEMKPGLDLKPGLGRAVAVEAAADGILPGVEAGVNWGRVANRAANVATGIGSALVIAGVSAGNPQLVAVGVVIIGSALVVKEWVGPKLEG